ncbi:MAG TPA: 16S rRNA (guanine(527)-N(7))-methyltransferase RsmG [Sphingomicrobium sp.]|nr:16S rRNA (guanine(527)-N(7))-methyltransferase RsmG [Sphingomicrobium sp.]
MIEAVASAAGAEVSRETWRRLEQYVHLLATENERQNLVSASTLSQVWERHVLDSAQLVGLIPPRARSLVDIGSGAGLPGMIVALLSELSVSLIEPRRLRADFLARTVTALGLETRVSVIAAKAEKVEGCFDAITARAVASIDRLLTISHHLSHERTVWLLPKGRNAKSELVEAQRSWHCRATSRRSITDPQSEILMLSEVGARSRR